MVKKRAVGLRQLFTLALLSNFSLPGDKAATKILALYPIMRQRSLTVSHAMTRHQDYKEKHKLDSKQIWNSPC